MVRRALFLPAGVTAHITVPLPNTIDTEIPFIYHCRLLAHEDHGSLRPRCMVSIEFGAIGSVG
jgi:hypothetical protein